MNDSISKNRILQQIKSGIPMNDITGIDKVLPELVANGYVKPTRNSEGAVFRVKLTESGRIFLDNGGYTAKEQKSKFSTIKHSKYAKELWVLILTIIGGLTVAYLSKRLGWI